MTTRIEPTLSKRLETIVSFVTPGSVFADIGADHASVAIALLNRDICPKGQAVDNKPGPYSRMVKAVREAGLSSRCVCTLGDGLDELIPEADCLILAGMGGNLIVEILERGADKLAGVKELIVDAHSMRPYVIKRLSEMGFSVEDSAFLLEDGIPYDVMKWQKRPLERPYSPIECKFGPLNVLRKSAPWRAYLLKERERLVAIRDGNNVPEARKNRVAAEIKDIEQVL